MISSTYSTKHKAISTTYLILFLLIIPKVNVININLHEFKIITIDHLYELTENLNFIKQQFDFIE